MCSLLREKFQNTDLPGVCTYVARLVFIRKQELSDQVG